MPKTYRASAARKLSIATLLLGLAIMTGCATVQRVPGQVTPPPGGATTLAGRRIILEPVNLSLHAAWAGRSGGKWDAAFDRALDDEVPGSMLEGAIDGAIMAPSKKKVGTVQATLDRETPGLHIALAERVAARATDLGYVVAVRVPGAEPAAADDGAVVFRLGLSIATSLEGSEYNPSVSWEIRTVFNLPDATGRPGLERTLISSTSSRGIRKWARHSEWLAGELRAMVDQMSETIADELFALERLTKKPPQLPRELPLKTDTWDPALCLGLQPLAPPTGPPSGEWPVVTDLQPTFRWTALRPEQIETKEAVTDITYEIRVARIGMDYQPVETVFHRTGLTETQVRPDVPLAKNAGYYWTVRAHYRVDGRPRVTEWTSTHGLGAFEGMHPNRWSPHFQTSKGLVFRVSM